MKTLDVNDELYAEIRRLAVVGDHEDDGSREMAAVTWDEIDPAQYAQVGTFQVQGTVEGVGAGSQHTTTGHGDCG